MAAPVAAVVAATAVMAAVEAVIASRTALAAQSPFAIKVSTPRP